MLRIAFASLALAYCGLLAAAPFQNGSFESGSVLNTCNVFDLPVGNTTITGWTVIQGNIDWEGPAPCGWVASNGSNSIDLIGQGFSAGGIAQTFDTVPGQTYQVSFDLAGNYGGPPVVKPLTVTVAGVTQNYAFDTTGKSGSNMGWTRQSFTFVASSTSSTLTFVSNIGFAGNAGAAIDNVTVTSGSPQATVTLLRPQTNAVIAQNIANSSCYRINFGWTMGVKPPNFNHFNLHVQHVGSPLAALDVNLTTRKHKLLVCNQPVIDSDLANWFWQVTAFDNSGAVLATSEQRPFSFAPCRLSNGAACAP